MREIFVSSWAREADEFIYTVRGSGFLHHMGTGSGEPVDMLKTGIIDPAKVTKQALVNASSIAGLMLTTEALVSEIKEKEKAPAGGGGMPGGMGGMY